MADYKNSPKGMLLALVALAGILGGMLYVFQGRVPEKILGVASLTPNKFDAGVGEEIVFEYEISKIMNDTIWVNFGKDSVLIDKAKSSLTHAFDKIGNYEVRLYDDSLTYAEVKIEIE